MLSPCLCGFQVTIVTDGGAIEAAATQIDPTSGLIIKLWKWVYNDLFKPFFLGFTRGLHTSSNTEKCSVFHRNKEQKVSGQQDLELQRYANRCVFDCGNSQRLEVKIRFLQKTTNKWELMVHFLNSWFSLSPPSLVEVPCCLRLLIEDFLEERKFSLCKGRQNIDRPTYRKWVCTLKVGGWGGACTTALIWVVCLYTSWYPHPRFPSTRRWAWVNESKWETEHHEWSFHCQEVLMETHETRLSAVVSCVCECVWVCYTEWSITLRQEITVWITSPPPLSHPPNLSPPHTKHK